MPNSEDHFPLSDCCWYMGKSSDDSLLFVGHETRCVPIIVSPTETLFAVGMEGNRGQVWKRALEQLKCPRVLRRSGVIGLSVSLFLAMALFVGVLAGFFLGGLLAKTLFPEAFAVVGTLRALGIVFFGFGSFIFSWLAMPNWYRPIAAERHRLLRAAALFPAVVLVSRHRLVSIPVYVAAGVVLVTTLACLMFTVWVTKKRDKVLRGT